jgi:hypothetical protein
LKSALTLALSCLAFAAHAQTLTAAKLSPPEIKPGEAATLTADFEVSGALNCNVRVNFGDGQSKDFKINQAKDVPLVVPHTYAKAGTYTVMVEPKTALPMFKCSGKNQSAIVKVVAPPVVAAAPAAAPAAKAGAASCPDGWKLNTKSVNKKSGAFTCTAKANTAAPASKLACPNGLEYFESAKKGQLGCRV